MGKNRNKNKTNLLTLYNKAEMGMGVLIIFITLLLVTAIAAYVLITTATGFQEKALATGSQTKELISSNINIVEISGTNPITDSTINNLTIVAKLAAGSEAINLDDVILVVNTDYKSAILLKYRGAGSSIDLGQTGFNTWRTQELGVVGNISNSVILAEDLDDDGTDDYVNISTTLIRFWLSTAGNVNVSLSSSSFVEGGSPAVSNAQITKNGVIYGYVTVATVGGTMSADSTFAANGTFSVTPFEEGHGYYVADYLQQGPNYLNGIFSRGDIIKFYVETPNPVGEDYNLQVNFFPKVGSATSARFATPNVMNTERVYLYP